MAHPGNLKYRTLIDSCKPRYNQATTKYERSKLAANIVTMWRSQTPEGRFLTKTHPLESDSVWHDIGNKDAIKKVSQTLRERRSYPMISSSGSTGMTSLHQVQQQPPNNGTDASPIKPPQPIVDAIISSAQQQEQLEKIRLIEEEIKQLKEQNISQGLIEQQLRHQQMYHHPNQQAQGQQQHQQHQQEFPQDQYPGYSRVNVRIPEELDHQHERLRTIKADQPMEDVEVAPFSSKDEPSGGNSLTSKNNPMPSREALWEKAESSGSFSLGSVFNSERSNLTSGTNKTNGSNNSSFSLINRLIGSEHITDNKIHSSPDHQTSGNSTVSTKTRTLLNESLHSISDTGSSRSFKLSSLGGSSNSFGKNGNAMASGGEINSDSSSRRTTPARNSHRGPAQSATLFG